MLARQANMSYGKWKALQPVVEIKEPDMPEGYRNCEWCRYPFKKRNGKRFCSDDCRIAAYAVKQKKYNADAQRRWRKRKKEANDG